MRFYLLNLMVFDDLEGLDLAMARLFLSWPSSHPGSAQEIVLACLQKKTCQEKQTGQSRKKQIRVCFFVLAWDGKLTIKFTCP